MNESILNFEKNLEPLLAAKLRQVLDIPVFTTFEKIDLVTPRAQIKLTVGSQVENKRPVYYNATLRVETVRERAENYEPYLGKIRSCFWLGMNRQMNLGNYGIVQMSQSSSERETQEADGGRTFDFETMEFSLIFGINPDIAH